MADDAVKSVSSVKTSTETYNPFNSGSSSTGTTYMDQSIWSMPMAGAYGGFEYMPLAGGGFGLDSFDSFNYMGSYPSFMGGFPMFTGGNYEKYWDMMDQYNQAIVDNQIRQNDRRRNAELSYNAPMENITIAVGHLNEKIVTDNQDQILTAYNDFKEAVRAAYGGSDAEVNARAQSIYKQQYNISLTEDIRKHSKSAFSQAFTQTAQGGVMVDHTSAEYNVSQITGQPIGRAEKDAKTVGHAVGGMTFGSVIGAIGGTIVGFITKNPKIGLTVGTLIGAAGGGAIASTSGNNKYK